MSKANLDECEKLTSFVEHIISWRFKEGHNGEVHAARLTLDPVFAIQRPWIFYSTIWGINQIYGLAPKPWPHLQEHFYHRPHTCSQALPYAYQFGCLLLLPLRKLGRLALLVREILTTGSYKSHRDLVAVHQ